MHRQRFRTRAEARIKVATWIGLLQPGLDPNQAAVLALGTDLAGVVAGDQLMGRTLLDRSLAVPGQ